MAKVATYTKVGAKAAAEATLDKSIFGVTPNHELLGLAYRAYLANGRASSAKTLTRAEVSGGGRKPWRQKGTGRARAGSSRIPHWRGGGVAFGNTGQENFTIEVPAQMRKVAVRQALSLQTGAGKVAVIESLSLDGKVKSMLQVLAKLGVKGNVLVAVEAKTEQIDRSTRNLAGVKAVSANYLNVYDLLNADLILITSPALDVIGAWLGSTKKAEAKEAKDE